MDNTEIPIDTKNNEVNEGLNVLIFKIEQLKEALDFIKKSFDTLEVLQKCAIEINERKI